MHSNRTSRLLDKLFVKAQKKTYFCPKDKNQECGNPHKPTWKIKYFDFDPGHSSLRETHFCQLTAQVNLSVLTPNYYFRVSYNLTSLGEYLLEQNTKMWTNVIQKVNLYTTPSISLLLLVTMNFKWRCHAIVVCVYGLSRGFNNRHNCLNVKATNNNSTIYTHPLSYITFDGKTVLQ